jgi:hypothetical protein
LRLFIYQVHNSSSSITEKKIAKARQQNDEKLPIKLKQLGLIVPINIVFPMHTNLTMIASASRTVVCWNRDVILFIRISSSLHMHVYAFFLPSLNASKE